MRGSALPAARRSTKPAPAREVRKTVTIIFSTSSTRRLWASSSTRRRYRRIISRYFIEVSRVLERHGGTVEKFVGDAVMAVFGIPVVHEDDALRAVRAAVELREALAGLNDALRAEYGVKLAVRTGLNTGEVVAGDPAQGQAFATGEAVALAQRLESVASPRRDPDRRADIPARSGSRSSSSRSSPWR